MMAAFFALPIYWLLMHRDEGFSHMLLEGSDAVCGYFDVSGFFYLILYVHQFQYPVCRR